MDWLLRKVVLEYPYGTGLLAVIIIATPGFHSWVQEFAKAIKERPHISLARGG